MEGLMRIALASVGLLLSASAAYAQLPLTGRAADECKPLRKDCHRCSFSAFVACIDRKLKADPAYNNVAPRTGGTCKSSSPGQKC
jgi:hypothetical protein